MITSEKLQQAVKEYQNGDTQAFNRIYEESYKYLHTCIMHVMKDEDKTMDMLQETYLEISKSIAQLAKPEKFLGWAATIANRKCFAYLKKINKYLLVDEAFTGEDGENIYFENIADDEAFIPESIMQDKEKCRLIREIISLCKAINIFEKSNYYNENTVSCFKGCYFKVSEFFVNDGEIEGDVITGLYHYFKILGEKNELEN